MIFRCSILFTFWKSLAKNLFTLHLSLAPTQAFRTLKLPVNFSIAQHVVVQRLYNVLQDETVALRQVWIRETSMCAKKTSFASLVCLPSHLKILAVIEKVHSCFKSQSELRISPVGSVNSVQSSIVSKESLSGSLIKILWSLESKQKIYHSE